MVKESLKEYPIEINVWPTGSYYMGVVIKHFKCVSTGVVFLIIGLFTFYVSLVIFPIHPFDIVENGAADYRDDYRDEMAYTISGYPVELITCIAGLITAIAGLITATTGFFLVLYQIIRLRLSEKSRHDGKKNSLTDDQLE